jgi:uncharacterized membrane protein (DUF2068 family)
MNPYPQPHNQPAVTPTIEPNINADAINCMLINTSIVIPSPFSVKFIPGQELARAVLFALSCGGLHLNHVNSWWEIFISGAGFLPANPHKDSYC